MPKTRRRTMTSPRFGKLRFGDGLINNNIMLHRLLRLNISPLFHMWAVEETGSPDACLSIVSSFLPGTYWDNVLGQTTITST